MTVARRPEHTFAPRLRRRGRLQRPLRTVDATGHESPGWETVADIGFGVTPISGREFFDESRQQGDVSHRVVFRYRRGVGHDWRVEEIHPNPGTVFEFQSPPRDMFDQRQILEVMARTS